MNATQIIKDALTDNDEVRLVLEIAARAREREEAELPAEVSTHTEIVPTSSLVPLETRG
jgi:hypothetical protein